MYCVKFWGRLREKFGFFTEGNSEGFREQAKAAKRTKVFAAAEDKAFVSFVVFCLESSPVLRAPTPPGAPRHPPSHSFGVAGSEPATTSYERFL
jgi:hypothetical protein